MSLEEALQRNTEAIERLIVVLQSGAAAVAQFGAAANVLGEPDNKTTGKGKAKTDAAKGETVYWLIEAHNTVYAQEPGKPGPNIEGAVKVTKEVYEAKKQEFANLLNSTLAKHSGANESSSNAPTGPTAQAGADAAQQSKATQSDTTQPATASGAQPAASDFQAVTDKMMALNKAEGHGREAVLKVLKQFLPNVEKPTVTMLKDIGKNAEVIAAVDALLNPAAEAEFDPLA